MRHSSAWSLAGNFTYAASQWAVLTTASKLGSPQMVGQLALAFAITAPVFLLANLQLRAAQATDVIDRYAFCEYLGVRLVSTGSAFAAILFIAAVWAQSRTATAVMIFVAAAKALESISDVIHGFLQRHERMDLIAVSLTAKGLASIVAFVTALTLTSSIVWATAASAFGWCVILATYDLWALKSVARITAPPAATPFQITPRWSTRKAMVLVRMTIPLGLASMLISLKENIPRYLVQRLLGERGLGFFAATAYATMAGNLVVSALGQAALPRLAQYYQCRNFAALKSVLFRLSAVAISLGIAGILIAVLVGRRFLSVLYSEEYGQYSGLLALMMCAATISYEASILNCAMNSAREFRPQLPLFAVVVVISGAASHILVPRYALHGAAFALIVAYAVQLAGAAGIVTRALRRWHGEPDHA